jgi:hypothetical protein
MLFCIRCGILQLGFVIFLLITYRYLIISQNCILCKAFCEQFYLDFAFAVSRPILSCKDHPKALLKSGKKKGYCLLIFLSDNTLNLCEVCVVLKQSSAPFKNTNHSILMRLSGFTSSPSVPLGRRPDGQWVHGRESRRHNPDPHCGRTRWSWDLLHARRRRPV